MPLGHEDSQSYRRGVILGLTLAELLLLLLFLFLLLMSSILHRREQAREELQAEYDRAEQERRAFREALASDIARSLGEAVADDFAVLLTPQELSEPLARIGELSADNRHVRAALAAAQSELSALRDTQPPSQRDASLLREENAALRAQPKRLSPCSATPTSWQTWRKPSTQNAPHGRFWKRLWRPTRTWVQKNVLSRTRLRSAKPDGPIWEANSIIYALNAAERVICRPVYIRTMARSRICTQCTSPRRGSRFNRVIRGNLDRSPG